MSKGIKVGFAAKSHDLEVRIDVDYPSIYVDGKIVGELYGDIAAREFIAAMDAYGQAMYQNGYEAGTMEAL